MQASEKTVLLETLPDGFNVSGIPENGIFCDEWKVKMFCGGNYDFVMKFRNIFQIDHFLKYGNIEWNDNIVFAPGDLCEQFPEIKGNPFLSKILKASAITMEGIKIMPSPLSHFWNIWTAFDPNLGLSVNHHSIACVSATEFMDAYILVLP